MEAVVKKRLKSGCRRPLVGIDCDKTYYLGVRVGRVVELVSLAFIGGMVVAWGIQAFVFINK